MENRINIFEFDKRKSPVSQVAERIEEAFNIFKGADLLIVNRRANGDFIGVMGESLFEYQKGVVLLERFYKKDKCNQKGTEVEEISQENKDLIREFTQFSRNIPKAATLTEEERDKYTSKIEDYTHKINNIKTEKVILKTYQYKRKILTEFDLIEEETLKVLSNLYAGMGLNFLMTMSWSSLEEVGIALTTVEHPDYIDLILIPVKQNDEN